MKRSFSALVLIPIVLLLILIGSPYVDLLVGTVALGLLIEWGGVCFRGPQSLVQRLGWFLAGILYGFPAIWIFWRMGQTSALFLLGICVIIWCSDIGAYGAGKALGGSKFAPRISPNKTWSGVFGGLMSALGAGIGLKCLVGWNPGLFFPTLSSTLGTTFIFVLTLGIFSQGGDLLESWVKRRFHLKDTGHLIPGHGGLLDRLDSLLAVGLFLFLLHLFF